LFEQGTPKRLKLRPPPSEREKVRHAQAQRALASAVRTALIVHYPAGIEASPAAWNRMRAMGAERGFPDDLLLWQSRAFTFEHKREKEEESESQIAFAPRLAAAGVPRVVVRDALEALDAAAWLGLPTWGHRSPWQADPDPNIRILLDDFGAAQRALLEAWTMLASARPPVGTMRAIRYAIDNAMRQIHELTLTDGERTWHPPSAR
jgi:hypothetical protein